MRFFFVFLKNEEKKNKKTRFKWKRDRRLLLTYILRSHMRIFFKAKKKHHEQEEEEGKLLIYYKKTIKFAFQIFSFLIFSFGYKTFNWSENGR